MSSGNQCCATDSPGAKEAVHTERPRVQGVFRDTDLDHVANSKRAMRKAILALAWPVVTEQILMTVTQMADMIMVGRLGAERVAAVGLSNQPLNIAQGLFMGIGVGATALIARFIGANDQNRADRTATQALAISAIIAAILVTIGMVSTPALIRFMRAEPEVVPHAIAYMRVLMPGLFMLVINMICSAALRGAGDTRYPMRVNILLNLVNLAGNYILIYGHFGAPAMGVAGAALATTIARAVAAVMLLRYVFSGKGVIHVGRLRDFRFDFNLIRRILSVGVAASAERVSLSLGLAFYVRIVAALGTLQYAAHAIAINAESISYTPGFAFAVSATTMVGQALGADRPDVAERAGWESLKMSATLMGFMGLVLFTFPQVLIGLYVDDPEIIRLGSDVLKIMAMAQIPMASAFVVMGALRGAGDTRAVLFLTLASVWGVRLGLAWFFVNVLELGLKGAWYAMALDWVARSSIAIARFAGGRWKTMNV